MQFFSELWPSIVISRSPIEYDGLYDLSDVLERVVVEQHFFGFFCFYFSKG